MITTLLSSGPHCCCCLCTVWMPHSLIRPWRQDMEVKNLENASCLILHSHETNAMFIYTEGDCMLEALVTHTQGRVWTINWYSMRPSNKSNAALVSLNPAVNQLHAWEDCSSPYQVAWRLPSVIRSQSRKGLAACHLQQTCTATCVKRSRRLCDIGVSGMDKRWSVEPVSSSPRGRILIPALGILE